MFRARGLLCWGLVAALLALAAPSRSVAEDISAADLALVKAAEKARIQAIEKVYPTVVAIYGNNRQGGGSGVIYDPAGYALTNYHVVKGAGKEGWAGLADGRLYRWKLIGLDPGGDVAIIKLTGKKQFPHAALGNSDHVRVGDFVMAMGNPFLLAEDQKPTVTLGVVSGIKRFQAGQGNNLLVYGNCIQVDSSINPGNSGGPLFNLAGEVIGINGRGSFKERGRVNVGVGYAISIEQIKNFIPELLATKVAQHGTLNAVFGNRRAGVICYQLNLDSPLANAGMDVGARLIALDGHEIDDANQLTNLISTMPAGWPVEVVFDSDDRRTVAWVRLTDLPYGPVKKQSKPKRPQPKPKPAQAKPRPPEPDSPQSKPAQPINPKPVAAPSQRPGRITDRKVNQAEAARVMAAWLDFAGGAKTIKAAGAFRFEDDLVRGGRKVGQQRLLISLDGRVRVEYTLDGESHLLGRDGKNFWAGPGEETPGVISAEDALDDPLMVQALALATVLKEGGLAGFAKYELTGADKAAGRRAYRLRVTDKKENDLLLWMSMYDESGRPEVRLVKAATGSDGDPRDTAITFRHYREASGVLLPHRRRVVTGLQERVILELMATTCQAVALPADEVFEGPNNAEKK